VLEVSRHDRVGAESHRLKLTVESHPTEVGCPGCGVIAMIHGRRLRRLHDIPAFGAPVEVVWRQRRYRCPEPACPMTGFTEDHDASVRRTVRLRLSHHPAALTGSGSRRLTWNSSCPTVRKGAGSLRSR
jgi:transposase